MQSLQDPQTIISVEHLNKTIQTITEPFLGQIFGWVNVSYGDEIHLNFGKENITHYKNGRTVKEGNWIILASASLWTLKKDHQVVLNDSIFDGESEKENEAELHQKFQILIGKEIQSILIQTIPKGLKTTLKFSEDLSFELVPHPNNPDLPLWELFMPTEQVLTLENKAPFWSCGSIHDPD